MKQLLILAALVSISSAAETLDRMPNPGMRSDSEQKAIDMVRAKTCEIEGQIAEMIAKRRDRGDPLSTVQGSLAHRENRELAWWVYVNKKVDPETLGKTYESVCKAKFKGAQRAKAL